MISVTYTDVFDVCRKWAEKNTSDDDKPDAIMAVFYGGSTPAKFLSEILGTAFIGLKVSKYDSHGLALHDKPEIGFWYHHEGVRMYDPRNYHHNKLLIVDDVIETGDTMKIAVEHAKMISDRVSILSIVAKPKFHGVSEFEGCKLDYGLEYDDWVKFSWE